MTPHDPPAPAVAVRIRPATSADCARIANLCGQLGYPSTAETCDRRLRALPRDHSVIVADLGQSLVVAFAYVHPTEPLLLERTAELGLLVVDESVRGQRVGERLLDAAARWATESGFTTLRVRSNVVRADAHRFYVRLGFRPTKHQAIFDRPL